MDLAELRRAVDDAFVVTGRDHPGWPAPHPGRAPHDDEYSRLSHPERWRILGARADAWAHVLVTRGLATSERGDVAWRDAPPTELTSTLRLLPVAPGAEPLIIARSRLGPVDDGGVTLGFGDPAVVVAWFPMCGCDACDGGSQDEFDQLDQHLASVVSGRFRRLSLAGRGPFPGWWDREVTSEITVLDDDGWSASNVAETDDVAAILADPTGWTDTSGAPWFTP